MIYPAFIISSDPDKKTVTIQLKSEQGFGKLLSSSQDRELFLDVPQREEITVQQRKAIYAMVGDVGSYTGYSKEEMKKILKIDFLGKSGEKEFSLSNVERYKATRFIHYIIDVLIQMDIPIRLQTYQTLPKDDYILIKFMLNRQCWICGKKADIHHVDTVGAGNNRNEIHNLGRRLMALCREHHTEYHKIGKKEFIEKYHLPDGLKLNEYDLRSLGLRP